MPLIFELGDKRQRQRLANKQKCRNKRQKLGDKQRFNRESMKQPERHDLSL
jgi:hypothetical protein